MFEYVDSDGDGGLYVDEFYEFNESNPIFVRYTHCYQQHIRKCIFGIPWWVEKSRIIKSKRSKGTGLDIGPNRCESFCSTFQIRWNSNS